MSRCLSLFRACISGSLFFGGCWPGISGGPPPHLDHTLSEDLDGVEAVEKVISWATRASRAVLLDCVALACTTVVVHLDGSL